MKNGEFVAPRLADSRQVAFRLLHDTRRGRHPVIAATGNQSCEDIEKDITR